MKIPIRNVALLCLLVLILSCCSTYSKPEQTLLPEYTNVKHGQMEYYHFGSGTPVVLIPGYFTDVTSWNRDFLFTLAQHHHVFVLNNRNVGGSIMRSNIYTSKALANDTYQLIHTLRLHKPTVIGISMGGMIAEQLAVTHPDSLGNLVLINTAIAGRRAIHPTSQVEKAMLSMPENKLARYIIAVKLFFPPAWRMKMAYSLAADRFLPKQYTEIEPANIAAHQRQLVLHWANDDETARALQKLHLPVLILNGEADAVIPPQNSVILAQTIPHAKLVRWQDGGHAMIYQFPQQIAETINGFIHQSALREDTHETELRIHPASHSRYQG